MAILTLLLFVASRLSLGPIKKQFTTMASETVAALKQELETHHQALRALLMNKSHAFLERLRMLDEIPQDDEGDKRLLAELRSTIEEIQIKLKADEDATVAASRPLNEKIMTASMGMLPPSAQVDVDPKCKNKKLS